MVSTRNSFFRQDEYEIIYGLSREFNIKRLCKAAGVSRSGFYKFRERMSRPSEKALKLAENIMLFREYHEKYPSHGYRWLNHKICLDTGRIMSDPYAHKCCNLAGIKCKAKRYKYKKAGNPYRLYPNILLMDLDIKGHTSVL